MVILAKNKRGLRHLYELVTESHLKHFYRTARIPQLLHEKREGLLLGSACEAGLVQAFLRGGPQGNSKGSLLSAITWKSNL